MQCYYLTAGFLLFFVIFNIFNTLVFIGLRIQNKVTGLKDYYIVHNTFTAVVVVQSLALIFYFFLSYYGFQAYKEFKAIHTNGGGYCKMLY
jgi:hypothetical protein